MRPALRLGVLLLAANLVGEALADSRPPNIVVIIADDLGWNDVGWHGSLVQTPTLDKLVAGGVNLARHYVYPTCSPTRCGIFTGRNPSRFNVLAPIGGRSAQALPLETMTLPRMLKSQGYVTAQVGKWHLGLRPEVGPRKYGYDQSYGYFHGQIDPHVHDYKNGDRTWHRNDEFLDETGHVTDLLADEAVRVVAAQRDAPLFLWLAFSVPHHPLAEDDRWVRPYEKTIADPSRRLFAAAVTHMDGAIGRVIEALEKTGQLDDTLIVFTSDNGGQTGWNGAKEYAGRFQPQPILGNNEPLRDWKGSLYEGGVRVPAFAYWRGRLAPRHLPRPVSILDWLPTLAAVAGAKTDPAWKLEGRNVWPLLAGESAAVPPLAMYWNTSQRQAVLAEDWKLLSPGKGAKSAELYQVSADTGEKQNLADREPAKLAELSALLDQQRKLDP
ncbi:MAG: sulfatase-like hydrolase/transferase [Pirellulaceae bacterium]|nr:sulfatase-like hydrolase/transferase [Pirellulaceae bacterium]